MKKLLPLTLFVLSAPVHAFAFSHSYVCSDFSNIFGGAGCIAGVISLPPGGGAVDYPVQIDLLPYGTVYVSFDYAGTGTGVATCTGLNVDCADSITFSGTGSVTNQALTADTGNPSDGLYFKGNGSFTGSISNIVVTDSASPPVPKLSFAYSTTTLVIDSPTQDIFMGWITFFFAFWLVIWLFRRT